MGRRTRPAGQEGFTLIEVMAAAMVLVVGMLSVLAVLQTSLKKTSLNQQRVAATNLVRELTEAARSADYQGLTPIDAQDTISTADPGLASTSTTSWRIRRGTTNYTITADVCTYDDPADKIAAQAPDNRCANNPTTPTGDSNGDDFRRLSFTATWRAKGTTKTESFQQTALIVNPAGGIGPRIVSFPNAADVGPGGTTAHFTVTTSNAAAVHWNADDGVTEGDAVRSGTGYTNWTIDWDLKNLNATGAVLDGTYTVTAQALDDLGVAGDSKIATVTVNRSAPFAVQNLNGGHDTRAGDWVDLDWTLNSERDISGYQVLRAGPDGAVGTSDDVVVCPPGGGKLGNGVTSCQDTSPPSTSTKYFIRAYDSTQAGPNTVISVSGASSPPASPSSLVVSGVDAPTLTWSAVSGAAFYRVYRDGTTVASRVNKTTALTYADGNDGQPHTYYVTAVNSNYNESPVAGPVGWTP